ncbi:hypothetical protein NSA16_08890 [Ligilactobacillus murinus]|nr:hypothetical protein [Ligilactobacillus murinus]
MNDKDFKEVLKNIFGLDAETLHTTLTEEENIALILKIVKTTLKSGGFRHSLVIAENADTFACSMPDNPIVAACLIGRALERAPKGTLEIILSFKQQEEK